MAALSAVQTVTDPCAQVGFVDQGYAGDQAETDAVAQGIRLEVVKLEDAKRGFVLRPRRWVVERLFAWATRHRLLTKASALLPDAAAGLLLVAFSCLMLHRLITGAARSP